MVDGLYGGLVVHAPAEYKSSSIDSAKYGYDKELLLLIGDWYHRPAHQVLASYMRAGSNGKEVGTWTGKVD